MDALKQTDCYVYRVVHRRDVARQSLQALDTGHSFIPVPAPGEV